MALSVQPYGLRQTDLLFLEGCHSSMEGGDVAASQLLGADERADEEAKALLLAMEKYHPIVSSRPPPPGPRPPPVGHLTFALTTPRADP